LAAQIFWFSPVANDVRNISSTAEKMRGQKNFLAIS